MWLSLPLRGIIRASRFQFVIHGQGLRVFYLRLRRRVEDRPRGELVEVEGVVLELGTPEVCNSEDCQRGFANATPARSADLIAPIEIQLTGLGGAKQKRSVSAAICRIRRGEAELPKAVATAVPSEFMPSRCPREHAECRPS